MNVSKPIINERQKQNVLRQTVGCERRAKAISRMCPGNRLYTARLPVRGTSTLGEANFGSHDPRKLFYIHFTFGVGVE